MFDVVYKDPETGKLSQYTVFAVLRDVNVPHGYTNFLVWDGGWFEIHSKHCTPVTKRGAQM